MIKRKTNRLRDYDHSQDGYYFITICTKDWRKWFGGVENNEMVLNQYGKTAEDFWKEMPIHFGRVEIDEFRVMPNHIHGIVIIRNELGSHVGNAYMRSLKDRTKMLLSKTIQQYKASASRKINSLQNAPYFQWQKSFYDHIIRNEESLQHIRQYIVYNPLKWGLDIENRNNYSPYKNCSDYYEEVIGGHKEP